MGSRWGRLGKKESFIQDHMLKHIEPSWGTVLTAQEDCGAERPLF